MSFRVTVMVTRLSKKKPARDGGKVIWKTRAELLRVLAHPVRLMILEALSEGPLCVKDLNVSMGASEPATDGRLKTGQ